MKILIDMNLSPDWVETFAQAGIEAVHWSTVGNPSATDRVIMNWAVDHNYIVFTNDLDFGTLLAATQANSPSVVQVRTQDLLPAAIGRVSNYNFTSVSNPTGSGCLDDNRPFSF